jgi:RNA polymerase sigma-70 factor (ECF subfamily)
MTLRETSGFGQVELSAELSLVKRLLKGDEEAFASLYRAHSGPICRFALQMTGRMDIAEDVTQETFLALALHGKRYDPARGTVLAFLYGISRNLVLKRLEKERHVSGFPVLEEFSGDDDVLGDLARRESIEEVRRAVLSLPPAYREAVVLCELGEASYEDAAFALGCPIGTVRSRLSRARAMLARKLMAGSLVL